MVINYYGFIYLLFSYLMSRLSTRVIRIDKDEEDPIGFSICGGNRIGIFVKNLSTASVAEGLKNGDRLLSVRKLLDRLFFFLLPWRYLN